MSGLMVRGEGLRFGVLGVWRFVVAMCDLGRVALRLRASV